MTPELLAAPIQPVEPGYRHVLRLGAALFWGPVFIGSLVANWLFLRDTPVASFAPLIVGLLAFGAIVISPDRVYRRLGYSVDGGLLRVVRGWLSHTDTIVPFVRVQHIDLKRGLLDNLFGTATLVVHTAGTHNSIVSLPGLSPAIAASIRDDIRSQIRSDFE